MKRRPLIAFFVLMFAISWSIWLPLALAPDAFSVVREHLYLLGAYGPCLAALLVTALVDGWAGLGQLFRRLLIWRVRSVWYLVALLLPAGISLLSLWLHFSLGGDMPDLANPPIYHERLAQAWPEYNALTLLAPYFLLNLVMGSALGEELGWRGFALVRLQQRFSALDSSLILAVVWALWAQPLLHVHRSEGVVMLFLITLVGAIPAQVLSTWLFNSTGGSLLLVLLYNNAFKITDQFITPPLTALVVPMTAYWIVTLLVVSAVGAKRLSLRTNAPGGPLPPPDARARVGT